MLTVGELRTVVPHAEPIEVVGAGHVDDALAAEIVAAGDLLAN
jgi:hypothetical protein